MNKAEMIEKYGEQWYEDFKAKSRKSAYEKYHANEELARARLREKAKKNIESRRAYVNTRRTVYRINSRDSLRLKKLGLLHDGLEAHHMKYHTDKKDPTWIDDICIMTKDEHRKWHREHPEFDAMANVV